MDYIKELKIAIINKNLEKLKELSVASFTLLSEKEAKEALALIKQAIFILQQEKGNLSNQMKQIKKLQKFNANKDNNFNLKA